MTKAELVASLDDFDDSQTVIFLVEQSDGANHQLAVQWVREIRAWQPGRDLPMAKLIAIFGHASNGKVPEPPVEWLRVAIPAVPAK